MKALQLLFVLIFFHTSLFATTLESSFIMDVNGDELSYNIKIDDVTSKVTITATGPSTSYFAIAFNQTHMGGTAIVFNSDQGKVTEQMLSPYKLVVGQEVSSINLISETTTNGNTTFVIERDLISSSNTSFDFSSISSGSQLDIIYSKGNTTTLEHHGVNSRGTAKINFEENTLTGFVTTHEPNISIYPNPATDYIKVDLNETSEVTEIKIFSVNFKEIKSTTFTNSNSFNLSTEELTKGNYMISIKNGKYSIMNTFSKQ